MNLHRIALLIFLLVAFGVAAKSQQPKAVLVDEFANFFRSDALRLRLDNFYAAISQEPGSVGSNTDAGRVGPAIA